MKQKVLIIGGGPAAMMLADTLDSHKFQVQIIERNKALGRKFLVAGKGGFNLSHSEGITTFIDRYTPVDFLSPALQHFDNEQLRNWLAAKDIPTFIGSSKRVFPEKGIKPIEVLQAILKDLGKKNVDLTLGKLWTGWDKDNQLIFDDSTNISADVVVFALGGGSWKKTGSDGAWTDYFSQKGITVDPFLPANCAYQILWNPTFLEKNEGLPLKNIAISCAGHQQKGEAMITSFGLEGNAIYALSPQIQGLLVQKGSAQIYLDLKPMWEEDQILADLSGNDKMKITDRLRKSVKLSAAQINLLKSQVNKEEFFNIKLLAQRIKNLPLLVTAAAALDEAISTTGGISLSMVTENYELRQMKNHYCIGEMLNWNAPTGGYLLQACFSMGRFLGDYLNKDGLGYMTEEVI